MSSIRKRSNLRSLHAALVASTLSACGGSGAEDATTGGGGAGATASSGITAGSGGGASTSSSSSTASGVGGSSAPTGGGGAGGSGGSPNGGPADGEPSGWAASTACGPKGTTGGGDGQRVKATTMAELETYLKAEEPLVIELSGTFAGDPIHVRSDNKTLVGDGHALITGTLTLKERKNIIIQNLVINANDGSGNALDGIEISGSECVWVDHVEIFDAADGNLDVVRQSSYVTVSWSKFHYTAGAGDPAHKFSSLVGSGDGVAEDAGRLKVTFHHNWWGDGVTERMPRTRYGDIHVYNNYYNAPGNNYCVGAGFNARLLIENNHFENVKDPHLFYDAEPTAQIVATGNKYVNTTGKMDAGQGASFVPEYSYGLDAAEDVKWLVMEGAGPH
ncbi:hypothetical protein WME99_29810 [Sorangium sp. So ce136]|uniref:pectate lyase family protein n=1 Tax=Sorangium sp. So ce136 TaxID=3133284 RepID=UPI003F0F8830